MVNEEKVKAFFNDEEKVKALASDEAFMKKLVNGEITAEACKEKFEGLGLSLTLEEAGEILESTKKAMSIPNEKLDEIDMENIAGGKKGAARTVVGGVLAGGAVGMGLASLAYFVAGAWDHNDRYIKRSAKFAAAAAGMGVSSGIILSSRPGGIGGNGGALGFNNMFGGGSPVDPSCPPTY